MIDDRTDVERWVLERLRVGEAYDALSAERDRLAAERERLAALRDQLLRDRLASGVDDAEVRPIVTAHLDVLDGDRQREAEDRRAAAIERSRTLDDLRQVAHSVRDLWSELESSEARRHALEATEEITRVFLLGLSHDLKSPLSAVIGFGELLAERLDELSPEHVAEASRRIASSGRHIQVVVDNFLDAERIRNGVVRPRRRTADVAGAIRDLVTRLEPDSLDVEIFPDRYPAAVDVGLVQRIAENLLVNAARHCPHGTAVTISVSRHTEGVLLTFADDGPGVSDELKSRLFDEFEQGDPGDEGYGLGLYLVRRFAELHGGRVWVDDPPGGGAAFRVLIATEPGPTEAPDDVIDTDATEESSGDASHDGRATEATVLRPSSDAVSAAIDLTGERLGA